MRALADALGLSERERAELAAAVPRRSEASGGVELANGATDGTPCIPAQPTPLLGRDEELAIARDQLIARTGAF